MKRTTLATGLIAAAIVFATSPNLNAQATAPAAPAAPAPAAAAPAGPVKIGTMNFEASVLYTNEGQRDFDALQKQFQPRKDKLEAESKDIDALQKQLQANGEKLSDEERATRVRAIESKQKTLQRESEDFQNDAQAAQQTAFQKVAAKVGDYVQSYAQENGYTAILEVGGQSTSVIYAVPSIDVTRAIIAGYNTKSGVPAPPTPAAGAPGSSSAPRRTPAPAK